MADYENMWRQAEDENTELRAALEDAQQELIETNAAHRKEVESLQATIQAARAVVGKSEKKQRAVDIAAAKPLKLKPLDSRLKDSRASWKELERRMHEEYQRMYKSQRKVTRWNP